MKAELNSERAALSEIYFCNSTKMLKALDRKDLPKSKREAIKTLHRLEFSYNYKILFFIGLWMAAGLAMMRVEALPIQLLCCLVISFSLTGLPILMHDANHGLLSKNRVVNRWLGFVCGLPGLVSTSAYRSIHLEHHAHTGTEKDPDSIEQSAKKSMPLVLFYYLFFFIGIYLYLPYVAIIGFKKAKRRVRGQIILEYALILVAVGLAFWTVQTATLLKLWVFPLLIGAQISNVRGLAEHGLTTSGNPFTDTRTITSNKFVSFMMSNLNYHLEHHLFPGVPWYNLPKLHDLLQDEYLKTGASVYPSYTRFLIDFLKATWSGIIPRVRLIPEHLREDICL